MTEQEPEKLQDPPTLYLTFTLGKDPYALAAEDVVEVVPRVELKQLPGSPPYVAGLMNYRGAVVPVIDLCQLMQGRPCGTQLSTRVVVVHYWDKDAREARILGLMAEQLTETVKKTESAFKPPGISFDEAPYLAGVSNDSRGMLQRVRVEHLLPTTVRAALFRQEGD